MNRRSFLKFVPAGIVGGRAAVKEAAAKTAQDMALATPVPSNGAGWPE